MRVKKKLRLKANRLNIPVVAIVDTNTAPTGVDYIVPGNDDAMRAIKLYCEAVADTIIDARGKADVKKDDKAAPKTEEKTVRVKKIVKKKLLTKLKHRRSCTRKSTS